jgi:hypothetical protein
LLEDKVLVGQKNAMHDQFGQYWFSDIFHTMINRYDDNINDKVDEIQR